MMLPDIALAHWNPHWQCFAGHPSCAANATAALSTLLSATGLDFANIVEMEAPYTPPSGWSAIAPVESCGQDWDTLFYNSLRWRRLVERSGCMFSERSFAAGVFQSWREPSLILTVLGAHYPQTLNVSTHAYAQATANLGGVLKQLGANRCNCSRMHVLCMHARVGRACVHVCMCMRPCVHVALRSCMQHACVYPAWHHAKGHTLQMHAPRRTVLLADTNTEGPEAAAASASHHGVNKTNLQILLDLGLLPAASAAAPAATPLYRGCCYSDGFSWQGDRIVANFGSVAASHTLFDPAPAWGGRLKVTPWLLPQLANSASWGWFSTRLAGEEKFNLSCPGTNWRLRCGREAQPKKAMLRPSTPYPHRALENRRWAAFAGSEFHKGVRLTLRL